MRVQTLSSQMTRANHLVASNVGATTVTALAFVELFPCHCVKRCCSAGGVVERLIVISLGADGDGG